jgi:RNA polymerase sigma factor (sigma-70 family)
MTASIALAKPTPAPPAAADNERIAAAVAAQGPRLRAFVRRQVADLTEVEDIVQDAFERLVSAYRLMEPVEHVAAWLRRVARNRIIDRFRQQSRTERLLESASAEDFDAESDPADGGLGEGIAPLGAGPEARYERDRLAEQLVDALNELPPEQRAVFVAHELDGRSYHDLAAATGIGVNTLLGRKHAAMRHLRRRLQALHAEFNV